MTRSSVRKLPPPGTESFLVMLWPTNGGWEGRLKRLEDGKEIFVDSLEALGRVLEAERNAKTQTHRETGGGP